ncbi:MAG: HD domain-containing protein [Acutalibacteraceae bacterium]|nr:HD domain-containing protein [Acutalibacteraceae bacterium]
MNFIPAGANGLVDCFLLVKASNKKTSSKGDEYLDMTLADKSGEINAKLWSYIPTAHGEYQPGDVVKVRGTVSQYNGTDQLRIEKIRHATPGDQVDTNELVQSADYSGEAMFNELVSIAESFKDEDIKKITLALLSENKEKLLFWPAAFKLHHAIRSGLMMHVLSIVRLAQRVAEVYPFIDRDLLLAGAILHDIAKTAEYEMTPSGLASGYTVKGNLVGHLAMGAMMIGDTAKRLGIDSEAVMLLQHMVLSHHGEPEFGAAVRPAFIEAELLSQLDMMDARMFEMREATEGASVGEFTGKLWSMDNRKLYNHGREDFDKETKLF